MLGVSHFSAILDNLPFLARGMELSLLLTLVGASGGVILGTILALIRLSAPRALAIAASGYVNLFRSVPLILVIFWFYILVPIIIGRPVGSLYSAIITFVAFEAAYYCEIIRAGIQSVPRNQFAAAQATGMRGRQTMLYVVLPQAVRNMTPVFLNQVISLFQDTSLVYVVSLRDFLTSASIIALNRYRPIELYTFAAVVYFLICSTGTLAIRRAMARRKAKA